MLILLTTGVTQVGLKTLRAAMSADRRVVYVVTWTKENPSAAV